jgi:pilus retraction protein PilT
LVSKGLPGDTCDHSNRCFIFRTLAERGLVKDRIPVLEELGLPPVVKTFAELKNGLVLITGPTGSGKTTTLAALVHEINKTSSRHIITIEDPIEYAHAPLQSAVTQRQVGRHVESFASALRSSLRESPDVVVTGEMRDLETIQVALQAAETGVLVFGTLRTNSASKAADRIIDAFPDESRDEVPGVVSVMLRGVLAQMLCKRASGEGRVAVLEVMLQTIGIANLIREAKCYQIDAYLQTADPGSGMQSPDSCIFQYMAPEQASNFGGVTHLADLYALGCIAYQMFTGAVPFDAAEVMPILMAHMSRTPEPPRQRNPAIPAELEAVILRLLAKKPEERVQSCRELAAILLRLRVAGTPSG